MSAITQILLVVSYAIFGIATAVFLSFLDVSAASAQLIGAVVFVAAWQAQLSFYKSKQDAVDEIDMHRVEEIEKLALKLREDVSALKESVSEQSEKGDEKDKKLVTELKMLQEFLLQVMQKEARGKKSSGAANIAKPVETAPEPDEQMTAEEIEELGLAPEEAALVVIDDSGNDDEEALAAPVIASDRATAENDEQDGSNDNQPLASRPSSSQAKSKPAAAVPQKAKEPVAPQPASQSVVKKDAPKKAAAAQRRLKATKPRAPIRLIKREDQLLSVIKNSLSENRVDLYLQPIVSLPSRKTAHFECFSRVRDEEGRVVLPRQYMKVAETKGLIGTIDNLLMFRLVQLVRRLGKRRPDVRFFLNMSRYSISDNEFLPQFIDFMISNDEFASRMVFEISQDDYLTLEEETVERLRLLGKKGFAFSMDMVTDFEQDFAELERSYFKYIKADISDIVAANPEPGDIEEQKAYLHRRGMQLVASKIETEDMVIETLDSQIELAQGYLFGEPISSEDMDTDL